MIAYLHINGSIGKFEGEGEYTTLVGLVAEYESQKKKGEITEVEVKINSQGGYYDEGMGMYDFLMNLKKEGKKITTIAGNMVASIATAPFLAGDVRIVSEGSQIMIHAPMTAVTEAGSTADDLEAKAKEISKYEKEFAKFYADNTGSDLKSIEMFMKKDSYMSAQEALDLSFATQINEPLKAVAYIKIDNQKQNKMSEEVKTLSAKFDKLVNQITAMFPVKAKSRKEQIEAYLKAKGNEVMAFIDYTLMDGSLISVNVEGEDPVGGEAVIVDAEGNFSQATQGEYELNDGSILVVGEGGIVSELKKAEAGEEMEAIKSQLKAANDKLEVLSAENNKLKSEASKVAQSVETKLSEMKEVVTEADELKANLTAIVTEFKIPKDRLIAKRVPQEPSIKDEIAAIREAREKNKNKSFIQQLR